MPDYQREYVWGEVDPKGERGDEVEQFLSTRSIPLARALTETLKNHREKSSRQGPHGFVFCKGDGSPFGIAAAFIPECRPRSSRNPGHHASESTKGALFACGHRMYR